MSTRYQLYQANTVKLVESLVIKSTETAEALNQWIKDYYGADAVIQSDPTTWKYYLNLAGLYHSVDEVMSVVSWDTLETIVFSKENLEIHRATFKAYAYGSTQYMELVKKYPNQELLIRGILSPVDIHTAIDAENGTVLAYNTDLVEENEYSLISKINQWIYSYKVRWVNEQYGISDELYEASHHAMMYLFLVPAVLNFRLMACKTNEAHSYHITEYLLSHGLPEYSIVHMTKKQMLFFYRNIKYIQRNAGTKDTFAWVLEHVMTERSLPISEYVMRHNSLHQLEDLLPAVEFQNKPLNNVYGTEEQDNISTLDLLYKEDNIAPGNAQYREDHAAQIEKTLAYSKSGTVLTKVLQSAIIDYTETGQNRPEEVLLSHWLYLSVLGKYRTYTTVTNPRTGEVVPMIAKDAFTLMIYAWTKSMGIDLLYVPKVVAKRVLRIPAPTTAELMKLVDNRYVKSSVAKEMLSYSPSVGEIISTEAFNVLGNKIYTGLVAQMRMSAREEHEYIRAQIENMFYGIYCDKLCELEPEGTLYSQWFIDRTLNFDSLTRQEFENLYVSLVEQMTGTDVVQEPNLASLQRAMLKLFEYLSSYSVQFVKKINNDGLINLNRIPVRMGDFLGASSSLIEFYDDTVNVDSIDVLTKQKINLDLDAEPVGSASRVNEVIRLHDAHSISLTAGVDIAFKPNVVKSHYEIDIAPVYVNSIEVVSL